MLSNTIKNIYKILEQKKLESLLNPENEDAYLNYLCSKLSYYNCSEVPIYYDDLKEFYGNKFENYLIDFINKVDDYYKDITYITDYPDIINYELQKKTLTKIN